MSTAKIGHSRTIFLSPSATFSFLSNEATIRVTHTDTTNVSITFLPEVIIIRLEYHEKCNIYQLNMTVGKCSSLVLAEKTDKNEVATN